jgi:tetratricopeptide (TPR) repeat protein
MWEQRMLITRSLADMDRAIALNPREASAYAYRASLYKEIGALDAALRDVQEAVKLAPKDPLSYRYKGIIHLSRGEQQASCEAFEKALQLGYTEQYDDEVWRLKREFCE